jgi:hypothetical protein
LHELRFSRKRRKRKKRRKRRKKKRKKILLCVFYEVLVVLKDLEIALVHHRSS